MFHKDYKSFNPSKFDKERMSQMMFFTDLTFSDFQNIFLETLNNSAPVNKKNVRFNNNLCCSSLLE